MGSVHTRKHQQIRKICTEKKYFVVQRFILIVCNSDMSNKLHKYAALNVKRKWINSQMNIHETHFNTFRFPFRKFCLRYSFYTL